MIERQCLGCGGQFVPKRRDAVNCSARCRRSAWKRRRPRPVNELQALPGEVWRPVPGYEGRYEVSDFGRVRSLGWTVLIYSGTREATRPGRMLRLDRSDPRGYVRAVLCDGAGGKRKESVHRLVLSAFVGECPDGMEACHGPAGVSDNSLGNLRWATHRENILDIDSFGKRAA